MSKYLPHTNTHKKDVSVVTNTSLFKSFLKQGSIIQLIVVFCVPVLLYIQTISFGITHFDDDVIISKHVTFLKDFGNVFQAFLKDAYCTNNGIFYRPLQTVSYMIDMHIAGGNSTWMFHVSNVLLVGFIACALYLVLKRFLIPRVLAMMGTLIYCVHPLFVSSVAWIPARGDLMLTLFSLLSFMFFQNYMKSKTIFSLILNWITFTLALFCKETAVVLPFLFLSYLVLCTPVKIFEKRHLFLFFLYVLSIVIWFALRTKAIGVDIGHNNTGISAFFLNIQTIPESLASFFIPLNLAPLPSFSLWRTVIGLIILMFLCVLFFTIKARTYKEKLFPFVWFFLLIIPPMFFKNVLVDYLDHRFFLPLIGILFFLLSIFPKKWLTNGDISKPWIPVFFILLFAIQTFVYSRSYGNPLAFYTEAIAKNDHSVLAFSNRATIEEEKGNYMQAIEDLTKLIAITPNPSAIYFQRGNMKRKSGDYIGSINDYTKTILLTPNYPKAYYKRGYSKEKIDDKQGAVDDYSKAVALFPNDYEAYNARGNVKLHLNENQGAMDDFSKAAAINPKYFEAFFNKGIASIYIGNYKEAINAFTTVIGLNPSCWDAYCDRAIAKYFMNDYSGSIEDCTIVLRVDSTNKNARNYKILASQKINKRH